MNAFQKAAAAGPFPLIAAAVALSLAPALHAAEAQQPADELAEVSVTGSRIARTGMTTPTPVASLQVGELAAMAPGTVVEALTQLPQFYGGATTANFNSASNNFFTSAGGGSLDLRGLGSKRTLTLLNGRRVVSSTIYGGPDINMFPESVLKNIETVTGGASAAYGTDAVSGVVNFILDTDFEGIRGHVQGGQTSRGDNDNAEMSLTLGRKLGESGHLIFSAEHFEQDPVYTWQGRDWYRAKGLIQSMRTGAGTARDNPRFIAAEDVKAINASYDGVITAWQAAPGFTVPASFTRSQFDKSGNVIPFVLGPISSTLNNAHTTSGSAASGTDNNSDRPSVMPESSRTNAFAHLDFDLGEATNVFVEGIVGEQTLRTTNVGGLQHSGPGQPITIFANNAFLPASVRTAMAANNIASFTMGRIGHSSDLARNAFVQQDTRVVSATTGFRTRLDGGFLDGWTVDGYAQYGRTSINAAQIGGIRVDRISLAVDAVTDPATGRVVCNVTLVSGRYPDCVPLNLFGRGNASQAALDWVTGFDPGVAVTTTPYLPGYPPQTLSYVGGEDKERRITLRQDVFELVASGDVWDGFGAGAVSMAVGGHYRKESVRQDVFASQGNPAADPFARPVPANNAALGIRGTPGPAANNSVEFQFSRVPFIRGDFDVKELFAEAQVPLLSGLPVLEQLNFNGAVRWAEYGGSGTIWSYKGGLDATVGPQLRLRGTYSRDVRAANLGERFDRTGGSANITDRGLPGNPTYPITITQGGNPEVNPEKADTITIGAIWRPTWLEGFEASVDWLQVDLKGSIESFTSQQIVDACYLRGDTDQCRFIDRSGPNNTIFLVNQSVQNVSSAKISGIDFEAGYTRPIELFGGGERLGLRLFATYLSENSTTNSVGVKTERAGDTGTLALPEWKMTGMVTYDRGPLATFLQARYVGDGVLGATNNLNGTWDVADNTVGSALYVDARVGYTMDVSAGSLELYANITNLLDRAPPVIHAYSAFSANAVQGNPALFDQLGRRYAVGVRMRF